MNALEGLGRKVAAEQDARIKALEDLGRKVAAERRARKKALKNQSARAEADQIALHADMSGRIRNLTHNLETQHKQRSAAHARRAEGVWKSHQAELTDLRLTCHQALAARKNLADVLAARLSEPGAALCADELALICGCVAAAGESVGNLMAAGGACRSAAEELIGQKARRDGARGALTLRYSETRDEHMAYLAAWAFVGFGWAEGTGSMAGLIRGLTNASANILVGYSATLVGDGLHAESWRWLCGHLLERRRESISRPNLLVKALNTT